MFFSLPGAFPPLTLCAFRPFVCFVHKQEGKEKKKYEPPPPATIGKKRKKHRRGDGNSKLPSGNASAPRKASLLVAPSCYTRHEPLRTDGGRSWGMWDPREGIAGGRRTALVGTYSFSFLPCL